MQKKKLKEKRYYFISTKELTNTDEISDEQWKFIAENNSVDNNYVLTEEEFQKHKDDDYLSEMEYRKI